MIFVAACAPFVLVKAATVTSLTDTMTDQTVGAVSNHDIRFINNDAVTAPGQHLIFGFAEAFVLTTITPSDVQFTHGPTTGAETAETLAASPGINIWGFDIIGTTARFTPPTNTIAGELPVGHKVIIKIGTNAGGTNRIINPSSVGSYPIIIYGGFGGLGTVRVPIVASSVNGFGVSFTVPAAAPTGGSDPGGGGVGAPPIPPPPPPAPSLIIRNVVISEITETSARVTWDTSESATASLFYFETGGSEQTVPGDGPSLNHQAVITGLTPGTPYSFILRAAVSGRTSMYGPGGFTTRAVPAVPNVQNLQAVRQADGTVQLNWINPPPPSSGYTITVVARTDRYPASASDGRIVFSGLATSASDAPGQGRVFYAAFVKQDTRSSSGAVTTLAAVTVPPSEPTRPTPSQPTPNPTPSQSTPTPVQPSVTPSAPILPTTSTVPVPVLPSPTIIAPITPSSTAPVAPTVATPTPVVVIPPPVTRLAVFQADTEWKIASGALSLARGEQVPRILAGEAIQLIVSTSQDILSGQVEVDGSYYALGQAGRQQYLTAFTPGNQTGKVEVKITLRTSSGEEKTLTRQIQMVSPTLILEREAEERPAAEAEVEVQRERNGKWETVAGSRQTLAKEGVYQQYVSAGRYRLVATKKGWKTHTKEFTLTSAGPVEMRVILEKEATSVFAAVDPAAGVLENVGNVAAAVIEVVRTPETQAAAEVAAPVAVIAAAGATVAAASTFNFLNYLRFLLTQPLLLLRRRRREKWGLVYNSLTKRPIDLAIVRLLDAKTGALRQTRITDALGRFAFLAPAGSYRLQVVKPGLIFPSALLADEKIDIDLVDLYHGEQIDALAGANVTPNIPLDPIEKVEMPKEIIRRKQWRMAQQILSGASLVVTAGALVIQPTRSMIVFAVLQVFTFFLFRRLAIPPKPKNWGIAYDGKTRKPLKRAIVRIFDKKYNKLLETQVTDGDGKYAFLAGKNVYYVTADHAGYDRFVSKDVDLRTESLGVVREPLALQTKNTPSGIPSSSAA